MDDGTVRERDLGGGESTDALGGWMDTKGFKDDGIEEGRYAEVSEFGVDGRDAINLVKDLREVCGVANRR